MRLAYKILLLLAPFLAGAVWLELRLRTSSNGYAQKKAMLETRYADTEILLLGDSQTEKGIDATRLGKAFNLAYPSQPLYYDSLLLAYWQPRLPKLKAVVIGLGVHRLNEGRAVAGKRQDMYDALYRSPGADPVAQLKRQLQILQYTPREGLLHALQNPPPLDPARRGSFVNPDCLTPAPAMALMRQSELAAYVDTAEIRPNLRRIQAITAFCQAHGLRLLWEVPPVSSAYRKQMAGEFAEHFRRLNEAGIVYTDYTQALPSSLFADADHPCHPGARVLGDSIRRRLERDL